VARAHPAAEAERSGTMAEPEGIDVAPAVWRVFYKIENRDATLDVDYLIRINTVTNNGRAWISIPTFAGVEFWVDVTDTMSGQYFEYHSPAGNRPMLYDPYTFVYP
jgi:hypothetical protein